MNIQDSNIYIPFDAVQLSPNGSARVARLGRKQSTLAVTSARDNGMISATSQLSPTLAMFRRLECQLLSPSAPLKRAAGVGVERGERGFLIPLFPRRVPTPRRGSPRT